MSPQQQAQQLRATVPGLAPRTPGHAAQQPVQLNVNVPPAVAGVAAAAAAISGAAQPAPQLQAAPAVAVQGAAQGTTPTTVEEWQTCPDRYRARITRLTQRPDGDFDVWVRHASGTGPESVLYQWPAGLDPAESGLRIGSPECAEP